MNYTNLVLGTTAFFLINETLQWGWIIARHAQWMSAHKNFGSCKNINYCMTLIAGVMTSILTCIIGIYLITSLSRNWCSFAYDSIMVCGVMTSLIHHYAILARCSELPVELWPLPSRFISRRVVRPLTKRFSAKRTSK